jgi:hypothetical protein
LPVGHFNEHYNVSMRNSYRSLLNANH